MISIFTQRVLAIQLNGQGTYEWSDPNSVVSLEFSGSNYAIFVHAQSGTKFKESGSQEYGIDQDNPALDFGNKNNPKLSLIRYEENNPVEKIVIQYVQFPSECELNLISNAYETPFDSRTDGLSTANISSKNYMHCLWITSPVSCTYTIKGNGPHDSIEQFSTPNNKNINIVYEGETVVESNILIKFKNSYAMNIMPKNPTFSVQKTTDMYLRSEKHHLVNKNTILSEPSQYYKIIDDKLTVCIPQGSLIYLHSKVNFKIYDILGDDYLKNVEKLDLGQNLIYIKSPGRLELTRDADDMEFYTLMAESLELFTEIRFFYNQNPIGASSPQTLNWICSSGNVSDYLVSLTSGSKRYETQTKKMSVVYSMTKEPIFNSVFEENKLYSKFSRGHRAGPVNKYQYNIEINQKSNNFYNIGGNNVKFFIDNDNFNHYYVSSFSGATGSFKHLGAQIGTKVAPSVLFKAHKKYSSSTLSVTGHGDATLSLYGFAVPKECKRTIMLNQPYEWYESTSKEDRNYTGDGTKTCVVFGTDALTAYSAVLTGDYSAQFLDGVVASQTKAFGRGMVVEYWGTKGSIRIIPNQIEQWPAVTQNTYELSECTSQYSCEAEWYSHSFHINQESKSKSAPKYVPSYMVGGIVCLAIVIILTVALIVAIFTCKKSRKTLVDKGTTPKEVRKDVKESGKRLLEAFERNMKIEVVPIASMNRQPIYGVAGQPFGVIVAQHSAAHQPIQQDGYSPSAPQQYSTPSGYYQPNPMPPPEAMPLPPPGTFVPPQINPQDDSQYSPYSNV